jgi:hypothetical protein
LVLEKDSFVLLVLQDDNAKLFDLDRLQNALFKSLPSDWCVVRFDCDRGTSAAVNNTEAWCQQSLLATNKTPLGVLRRMQLSGGTRLWRH